MTLAFLGILNHYMDHGWNEDFLTEPEPILETFFYLLFENHCKGLWSYYEMMNGVVISINCNTWTELNQTHSIWWKYISISRKLNIFNLDSKNVLTNALRWLFSLRSRFRKGEYWYSAKNACMKHYTINHEKNSRDFYKSHYRNIHTINKHFKSFNHFPRTRTQYTYILCKTDLNLLTE